MAIEPIKSSGYPATGQAFGRAQACLGSEDHRSLRIGTECSLLEFDSTKVVGPEPNTMWMAELGFKIGLLVEPVIFVGMTGI
jgi:hypothetical protein